MVIVTEEAIDKAMDIYYVGEDWKKWSEFTLARYRDKMNDVLTQTILLCQGDRRCNCYPDPRDHEETCPKRTNPVESDNMLTRTEVLLHIIQGLDSAGITDYYPDDAEEFTLRIKNSDLIIFVDSSTYKDEIRITLTGGFEEHIYKNNFSTRVIDYIKYYLGIK